MAAERCWVRIRRHFGRVRGALDLTIDLIAQGRVVIYVEPAALDERIAHPRDGVARGLSREFGGVAVKRLGTATDIASAILYFVSPQAAYTTGQTLLVDGGHIMF